jgi:hypothetical protein
MKSCKRIPIFPNLILKIRDSEEKAVGNNSDEGPYPCLIMVKNIKFPLA